MIAVQLAAYVARRTTRAWLTQPLRAVDAIHLIRAGEWDLCLLRRRPTRRSRGA